MKLKPIVASMLVMIGSVCPVLALAASDNSTQAQLDAMKANVAKLQAVVEQNNPGGFTQDGWWNRIMLSGQANIDGFISNRRTSTGSSTDRLASTLNPFLSQGSSAQGLAVDTANLYVDATVSDYTKAHMDLAYQTGDNSTHYYQVMQPVLNEAYAILGNFNKSPFYLMAGRQNVQFGQYDVYPMVYSFTQLLTQTKATAATIGYVDACSGFNAALFGFKGLQKLPNNAISGTQQVINGYGAKIGLRNSFDNWAYGVSVDYLNNLTNVDYVKTRGATSPVNSNAAASALTQYANMVGGVAFDGDLMGGPFDAKLRYVTATSHFGASDVPYVSGGALQANGAKPWAAGLDLGYGFLAMQHQSRLGLGYQQSGQAAGVGVFGLPQNRYEAQYMVNVSRFTDLGFDLYYDKDYGVNQGGTAKNATTGVLRLGVKFA